MKPPDDHLRDVVRPAILVLAVVILLALGFQALAPSSASAAPRIHGFRYGLASSYGPGLYGNTTACGQTLTPRLRGVAHRTLPCGTRLLICRSGHCTVAAVIDRGPFSGRRVLDLTARTTRDLCGCSPRQWGVRRVAWKRAPR